MFLTEDEVLME